jgi:Rod binding domain-containing protein
MTPIVALSSSTTGSAATAAPLAPTSAMMARAHRAAQQFEAVFLGQMFDMMEAGVPVDPNFGGGPAEPIYRGMLDQQYAKAVAARGGIGIAKRLYQEILKWQEVRS